MGCALKEEEIRPENLFNQYLSLAEKDVQTYFKDTTFLYVPCPACRSRKTRFLFRKMGFDYEECKECETLFNNPRPKSEAFIRYYSEAPSVRFWATHFYRETEEARRLRLIRPKAALVKTILERYGKKKAGKDAAVADIGAGYGVFCEELQKILSKEISVIAIEPAHDLNEICKRKGLVTVPKFFEDVTPEDLSGKSIIAATSFELLEHLQDPRNFIQRCADVLGPEALLIVTSLNWKGFDLQVLRERSKSIHPPHHINFFTPASLGMLLKSCGFTLCEITTPGKLDVDIAGKQLSDIQDPFIKNIVSADESVRQSFQQFLQDTRMSSHMMVVAQRNRK
jgi:2-polyprenyl-3-methyl-5-hydroxy-6-metoxy-1,4-benzoquinol methylase/ribosomal protein S27E